VVATLCGSGDCHAIFIVVLLFISNQRERPRRPRQLKGEWNQASLLRGRWKVTKYGHPVVSGRIELRDFRVGQEYIADAGASEEKERKILNFLGLNFCFNPTRNTRLSTAFRRRKLRQVTDPDDSV
jgi:hypothetical protein